mmetsp:Transcript_19958/g.34090  ORF Transcript_19958/g.34090 Transcript_19958/m.34090 type:complete len:103 (+) Transcript_19958:226-534(+)
MFQSNWEVKVCSSMALRLLWLPNMQAKASSIPRKLSAQEEMNHKQAPCNHLHTCRELFRTLSAIEYHLSMLMHGSRHLSINNKHLQQQMPKSVDYAMQVLQR